VAQKIGEICEICGGILLNTLCSTIVENSLQINLFMQNKAKVNIGKMNVSVAIIKDYDKKTKNQQRTLFKTKPNKAKVKIGKMNISVAKIKDYDKNNEKSTTNVMQNKAKQSQFQTGRPLMASRKHKKYLTLPLGADRICCVRGIICCNRNNEKGFQTCL
jgi:hypothetical protein